MGRYSLFIIFFYSSLVIAEDINNFLGSETCAECHANEYNQWTDSDHDWSMKLASVDTVFGLFNEQKLTAKQITTKFFKKSNEYWVRTRAKSGDIKDFRIVYTIGFYPTQQYLIETEPGKLQVFEWAWDNRPENLGGQRWYYLPHSVHKNAHWSDPEANWNAQCASCHTTQFSKNHDAESNTYNSGWATLNVSCEACHGPGKAHVQWAREENPEVRAKEPSKGLINTLQAIKNKNNKNNKNSGARLAQAQLEIETCAQCHSHRQQLFKHTSKSRFYDSYEPLLLTSEGYHVDGQIKGEVYEYGSYLQSSKYTKGVHCTSCHSPHSTELNRPSEKICYQCHQAKQYRTAKHHHHPVSSQINCLDCHMPTTTFMSTDERHDHSFRIPEPKISQRFKTRHVCHQCHQDKDAQWALIHMDKWNPSRTSKRERYAEVVNAQRQQAANADKLAVNFMLDKQQSAIERASVLSQMSSVYDQKHLDLIKYHIQHDDPIMRLAAINVIKDLYVQEHLDFSDMAEIILPLINDQRRVIRLSAIRLLSELDEEQLTNKEQNAFIKAQKELLDSNQFTSDIPELILLQAEFYAAQQDYVNAQATFRKVLDMNASLESAWIKYARFFTQLSRDADALQALQQAIIYLPDSAIIHHETGLVQVRLNNLAEAIVSLAKAATLEPANANFSYVYGLALNSYKRPKEALDTLKKAQKKFPNNSKILNAIVDISYDEKNYKQALKFSNKLLLLDKDNKELKRLIQKLKKK